MNIAKYVAERRAQIEMGRKKGDGEVGVWWLLPIGELLIMSVPFSAAELYGCQNVFGDHEPLWRHLRPHVPSIAELEYDRVPRGRVSYDTESGTFTILSSKRFFMDGRLVEKVIKEFRLDGKQVRFVPDEHYEIQT
jgi:hypothetical protein